MLKWIGGVLVIIPIMLFPGYFLAWKAPGKKMAAALFCMMAIGIWLSIRA